MKRIFVILVAILFFSVIFFSRVQILVLYNEFREQELPEAQKLQVSPLRQGFEGQASYKFQDEKKEKESESDFLKSDKIQELPDDASESDINVNSNDEIAAVADTLL